MSGAMPPEQAIAALDAFFVPLPPDEAERQARIYSAAGAGVLTPEILRQALEQCEKPLLEHAPLCGATDGTGIEDEDGVVIGPFGRCSLLAGHQANGWHQEWRNGSLWAEWRGPAPGERCSICGKDGKEH